MNEIIQNLEANATNGKENFCYISEKKLNALKELSKREYKENQQLKEIIEKANELLKKEKENYMNGCGLKSTTNIEGLLISSAVRTCDDTLDILNGDDK